MTLDAAGELRLDAIARALVIAWRDGSNDTVSFATLRERCRCAECRSARQQGREIAVAAEIVVTDAVAYGPNAIQLIFSDGHARGIFPFSYLRELASCGGITSGQR